MASNIKIPRKLPLLLVQDNVLLPGSSMRISVRSIRNMNMIKDRLLSRSTLSSTIVGVIPKRSSDERDDLNSVNPIGTAAVVVQVTGTNWPRPAYTLLVTGLCRFKVDEFLQETPFMVAKVTQLDKLPGQEFDVKTEDATEMTTLAENFREQASKLVDMLDISVPVVAKLKKMLSSLPSQQLPDICASIVKASFNEKMQVLEATDIIDRFRKTLPLLMRQIEAMNLLQNSKKNGLQIDLIPDKKRHDRHEPFNIRTTFKMPSQPDDVGDGDEIGDFETKIRAANMPPHAFKAAMKELRRLRKMPQQMPEHAMIRNYLELMTDLPWSKSSKDSLDIVQARKYLDDDHYGLEKLKKRILEYLAVRQLKNTLKGPILCFVGPPGVGKTSVGKSIARTLGREFHRIALGGVCDQSDIRGHRRTYIGSMPGRIIQGLKLVGVNNPVFLLDEIDKLGKSLHGDPAAALLEVLDSEQNNTFTDHYLNVPFDLSQVLFIATANSINSIPAPLLDRTELLRIPGYTEEEKINIAVGHLLKKQYTAHGLTEDQIQIPEGTIRKIVSSYTREAGVRSCERQIGAVCRAVAVRVAEAATNTKSNKSVVKVDKTSDDKNVVHDSLTDHENQIAKDSFHPPEMPFVIDESALEDILGPPVYENEMLERLGTPGIAVGLAWTAMGGQIMFVEASKMEGAGQLVLTGQLGDVMKESATLALTWLRSHATVLGLDKRSIREKTDVHIHFPAGAISKDGPSAGVTIVTVLVSLFCNQCARSDTAMTGEITLRGKVLPVGGIKEKVLAAHRSGVKRVIIPRRNEKDLLELPNNVREELSFILASRLEDVLNAAFGDGFPSLHTDNNVPSKL